MLVKVITILFRYLESFLSFQGYYRQVTQLAHSSYNMHTHNKQTSLVAKWIINKWRLQIEIETVQTKLPNKLEYKYRFSYKKNLQKHARPTSNSY